MITPCSDRIFIELEKQQTPILMDAIFYKDRANQGTVLAVGPLVTSVQTGDRVIFHPFDDLETPNPNVVVIREQSLLAKLDK